MNKSGEDQEFHDYGEDNEGDQYETNMVPMDDGPQLTTRIRVGSGVEYPPPEQRIK
jgi:hypothetical protein